MQYTPTTEPEVIKVEDAGTQPQENDIPKLPRFEEPLFLVSSETRMFYVGIPYDKIDAFNGALILDAMKLNYLDNLRRAIIAEKEKKAKIITHGMFTQMRENFLRRNKKV